MSGYGEPDWINPQTDINATTTVENNVGESITAPRPDSRYVTRPVTADDSFLLVLSLSEKP
jgi:hypothetical protein